jgi:hypothetical protein
MVVLNYLPTDCSPMPAAFHDFRFGIKCIFSSKTEIIDEDEGLNSNVWLENTTVTQ